MKTKICTKCKKRKSLFEFHKCAKAKDGYNWECKICKAERMKIRTAKPGMKKYRVELYLSKRYGITLDDYNKMFSEQNGCCAMCGKHQSECKQSLHVDHDHQTGEVRGLLCFSCNGKLGWYEKNKEAIENYLGDRNEFCRFS